MAEKVSTEDWQLNKTLRERNAYMLKHEIASDVTFMVRNQTIEDCKSLRFAAHSYMLISVSPVFRTMLCGNERFAKQDVIQIDDIEPEAFGEMLWYIYTEKATINPNNVMHLLHASKKYTIPSLTSECCDYLETQLCSENACTLLEQSEFFGQHALSLACLRVIQEHTDVCLQGEGFLNISVSTLGRILDLDVLGLSSETELFRRCLAWARSKLKQGDQQGTTSKSKDNQSQIDNEGSTSKSINQQDQEATCKSKDNQSQVENEGFALRRTLGDTLFKLRIPTMSAEEFSDIVSTSGILTMQEEVEIFRYIAARKKPEQTTLAFCTVPRLYRKKENYSLQQQQAQLMQTCNPNAMNAGQTLKSLIQLRSPEEKAIDSLRIAIPFECTVNVTFNPSNDRSDNPNFGGNNPKPTFGFTADHGFQSAFGSAHPNRHGGFSFGSDPSNIFGAQPGSGFGQSPGGGVFGGFAQPTGGGRFTFSRQANSKQHSNKNTQDSSNNTVRTKVSLDNIETLVINAVPYFVMTLDFLSDRKWKLRANQNERMMIELVPIVNRTGDIANSCMLSVNGNNYVLGNDAKTIAVNLQGQPIGYQHAQNIFGHRNPAYPVLLVGITLVDT